MKNLLLLFALALSGCPSAPVCNNGLLEGGELCDDGNGISGDGCDNNCSPTACGNGEQVDPEECDDGNLQPNDGCGSRCTVEVCGDAIVQNTEACDDGNENDNDACRNDCTIATCGDGVVRIGEECDDNNNIDGDGCDSDCTLTACGNRIVTVDEECDDGNANNKDGCLNDCTLASCGDGFIQSGVEACEDGNTSNTDSCVGCQLATCGDGFIQSGVEQCDDGNNIDADGCDADCIPSCGNGLQEASLGEACDDGNNIDADGCNADCSLTVVVQLTAGGSHTCALFNAGDVKCWGNGSAGRLGYGNTKNIGNNELLTSVGTVDVGGRVVQISAGGFHTCALLDNGAVRCWGGNFFGELGYGFSGSIGDNEAPSSAGDVNVGGVVTQIVTGSSHTCALLDTGNVRCWGANSDGELGYANTNFIGDDETPALAGDVNVGGVVTQIAAGNVHTCTLVDTGDVRCWGSGGAILGYTNFNNIGDDETPASVGTIDIGGSVTQIIAGGNQHCAILSSGALRCWGGFIGYPGLNVIGDDETPASVGDLALGGTATQVALGFSHACVLLSDGAVRCWGVSTNGELGYGNLDTIGDDESITSAGFVSLGEAATQIVTGDNHSCALLASGTVRCWGANASGQLGYGNILNIGDTEIPTSVDPVSLF